MKRKVITVLGSTGSIGVSTLDVVRQFRHRFAIDGLAAGGNVDLLAEQIDEFRPRVVSVLSEQHARDLARRLSASSLRPEILCGTEGYRTLATLPETEVVVSAIVGAAGLVPTVAAIDAGKDVALANKETLVIGGQMVTELAARRRAVILPVDSEHSAIFQALQGNQKKAVRRILLTASGGPFFRKTVAELSQVTPQAALRHPNWSMGKKVTIDSATLMNKGLEIIEARWLFDIPAERIAVHVHPESIVHSMVEYVDGSVIAQLGIPDMKIPIAYALSHPDRLPVDAPSLDLFALRSLTFYPPDLHKFPCLGLALDACAQGGTMPAVLNAANEVAVGAFLAGRVGFMDIPALIRRVMDGHQCRPARDLDTILQADRWARRRAERYVGQ